MTSKIYLLTLAVLSLAVIALLSTGLVYAQQLPPQSNGNGFGIGNGNGNGPRSNFPPAGAPSGGQGHIGSAPPGQQPPPPLSPTDMQQLQALTAQTIQTVKQFHALLHNDTSTAHVQQVLRQMTAQGLINCPTPFTNPGHCSFSPPGQEKHLLGPQGPTTVTP